MFFARMQIVAAGFVLMCATSSAIAQDSTEAADTTSPTPFRLQPLYDIRGDGRFRVNFATLDVDAVVPGQGPLFDRLEGGVGTSFYFGRPIGPIINMPNDGIGSWNIGAGFRHLWLDGNNGVQLNQPGGRDFDILDANVYLGTTKVEYVTEVLVDGELAEIFASHGPFYSGDSPTFILGVGVTGLLGGANADIRQAPFDPAKQQLINVGPVRDQAFVGGYEVGGKLGLRFRNGVEFDVHAGYGQFLTDFLQTSSSANGFGTIGVGVTIPLSFRWNGRAAPSVNEDVVVGYSQ